MSTCSDFTFALHTTLFYPPPQGVGVGLFRDRACAVEACNKLSGAQADGRKLELVLMNPDNHVSFSCRQVSVLEVIFKEASRTNVGVCLPDPLGVHWQGVHC
jgi:hypothetical protein